MIRACLILLALTGAAYGDEVLVLPSGSQATLQEVITDVHGIGLAYRFRFIVPGLTAEVDYERAEADMAYLCQTYALSRLASIGPKPAQIVISLSDRPVEFGASAPDVVQFFEAYRPVDDMCVLELH